ncbi:hypothetical protein PHPALM_9088 [Phytophthora palmivora]|uniref:Uncharacterized protein n=1 Tax=Phytophthora palmivora TaxID=4796 RepID=A0A2P4Y877_9STRA|nr:hypothetical protein PHPALM_9088 [Phytophthora palmivora]
MEVGKIEVIRLLHRAVVFAIALWYVGISVKAFLAAVTVLRGFEYKDLGVVAHQCTLISDYAGTTTIDNSPLVQNVLAGSTTPREDTLYLETDTNHSLVGCTDVDGFDTQIYSNTFLRFMFNALQKHASEGLSYITNLELIAPVVDCTFDLLASSDKTVMRAYYLARQISNTSHTLLLSTSFSSQDYEVTQQYQSGAGMLATIAAIDDMQASSVSHHFATALNYPYVSDPPFTYNEFVNIEGDNFWLFKSIPQANTIDPTKEVRSARRMGGYIDDPIAQSNIEIFCLAIGNEITGRRKVHYRSDILSYLFRERIDPVLAFAAFELGFAYRVELAEALPALKKIIVQFADDDYWHGLVQVSPFLARLSPMMFWTVHAIDTDRKPVVVSTVIAIFSTMTLLVIYIAARKAYRYTKSNKTGTTHRRSLYKAVQQGLTPRQGDELTTFESATGAALSKRFGVISGYDNYIFRDNRRYASIDAVYGNGYLIANEKFLIATEDMLALLVMKLTRVRFTNLYVIIGLIGRFTKERIDPAFALFLFEIIHSNRQDIIRKTSSVLKVIVKYVNAEYRAGIATVTDEQKLLSPMRLWTTHMLNGIDFGFLAASLFPKLLLVLLILVYVGIRKVYHRFYPDQQPTGIPGRSSADRSANEKAAMAQKGNLTNFEISTGAELEARYGLISDYKNYIFFKGLKFASADGVYCSGYVVANGKFLVGSKDLLSIIMIKAFRSRFTNVYVYAVDGNTVQRTAQLDYHVDQQFQKGPGLVLLVVAIDDTQATALNYQIAVALNYPYVADPAFAYSELEGIDGDNYWILQTLPNERNQDPAKIVRMARRFGRYKSDVTAQSNIEIAHWDLLSVYLNFASVISYLTRERIDPLVAFLTFELGWWYRLELANMFPALRKHITDFAIADLTSGLLHVSPGIANLSPIDLLTAYQIESDRKPVVFSAVISIFSPIVLMLAYILGRKSTGNVNFPFGLTREKGTGNVRRTTNAYRKGLEENKLTSFEVATGAALTKRFGVVSGYENYVIHDNKHIATIDAVYGNGFLVVNGKFLIGAQDLLPLILMKLTHVRFTNIFTYDIVDRNAVKETAELVYPSTITWSDLQHLDVTALI